MFKDSLTFEGTLPLPPDTSCHPIEPGGWTNCTTLSQKSCDLTKTTPLLILLSVSWCNFPWTMVFVLCERPSCHDYCFTVFDFFTDVTGINLLHRPKCRCLGRRRHFSHGPPPECPQTITGISLSEYTTQRLVCSWFSFLSGDVSTTLISPNKSLCGLLYSPSNGSGVVNVFLTITSEHFSGPKVVSPEI